MSGNIPARPQPWSEMNLVTMEGGRPLGTAAMSDGNGFLKPLAAGAIYLGCNRSGQAVGLRDDRHMLVCAGTRGGKGVSMVVPNLCLWPGSTVVIDPKGENAMVTARRRADGSRYCHGMGQKVHILDPMQTFRTADDSFADLKAGYNPLTLLAADNAESVDIAAWIADALIVSESSSDPYWENAARELLRSVILHVATWHGFKAEERTLVTVRQLLVAGDSEARKIALLVSDKGDAPSGHHFLFRSMGDNPAFSGIISRAGAMYENLEKNARRQMAGILHVAVTNTDFIDSEEMQRCLSRSDFELKELKTNSAGMSLYLCLPQRYMRTHFRWLRMMIALTVGEMERVAHQPACGYPVLTVLDEFPALRRMQVLENAAAQIAGFGVKLVFVVQTLAQLKDLYKDNWETLAANCGVKSFFCNDDHLTRDYVSKLIGECETVRTNRSYSTTLGTSDSITRGMSVGRSESSSMSMSDRGFSYSSTSGRSETWTMSQTSGTSASRMEGFSEAVHKRALLTPDEIGRYFGSVEQAMGLVLVSGQQPVALRRVPYHRDSRLWGLYDAHRDHPKPMTLPQIRQRRELEDRQRAERVKLAWQQDSENRRRRQQYERIRRQKEAADARWERYLSLAKIFLTFSCGIGGPVYLAICVMNLCVNLFDALTSGDPVMRFWPPASRSESIAGLGGTVIFWSGLYWGLLL